MIVALIAAVAENGVIGDGAGMPWRLKGELAYFREKTLGKPVVMGRKTFETLKGPLKDRLNIVVTRDPAYARPGIVTAASLEAALALAGTAPEIMIAGGGEIYRQALPFATRLYLTEVHAKPEGGITFPAFDRAEWTETSREFRPAGESDSAAYTVTVLDRKSGPE